LDIVISYFRKDLGTSERKGMAMRQENGGCHSLVVVAAVAGLAGVVGVVVVVVRAVQLTVLCSQLSNICTM
jgi:hypothetical protein